MKEIPLTRGKVALVDDADYEWLNQWKWTAQWTSYGFYAFRYSDGGRGHRRRIHMHREIANPFPDQEVDHINHDPLDNRRVNLRPATKVQNQGNQRKRIRPCSSKFKGVVRRRDCHRWEARITRGGIPLYLGLFVDEAAAARAYNLAAEAYFGEFAMLNVIDVNHGEAGA